jgi:hypothetical protein
MRVVLKQCVWERVGDDLVVFLDPARRSRWLTRTGTWRPFLPC